ncbi:hypothetical protein CLOP_g7976 [Closterium sp. NIES-67]|nr:hypothetical protein CLOP_g7976 [Closterium sp. NIES-67]
MGRPAEAGGSREPLVEDGAEVFDFLASIVSEIELAGGGTDLELRGKIEELRAVSSVTAAQTSSSLEQMQQQFATLSQRLGDLDRRVTSAMEDPSMRHVLQGSAPLFAPSLGDGRREEGEESGGTEGSGAARGEVGESMGEGGGRREDGGMGEDGVRREGGGRREGGVRAGGESESGERSAGAGSSDDVSDGTGASSNAFGGPALPGGSSSAAGNSKIADVE